MASQLSTTPSDGKTEMGLQIDAAPERDKILPSSDTINKNKEAKDVQNGDVVNDLTPSPRDRINTGASVGSLEEWCVMSEDSVNQEIFEDLRSSEAISQLASSLIIRDLLKQAEEHVSKKLVDQIFRAVQEVTEPDSTIVKRFLLSHNSPRGGAYREDDTALLVDLFLELLQCSPLPVEHNYLWLQLLYILILDGNHLSMFIEKKVAATVLGTMAVHRPRVAIQEISCSVLYPLALFTPIPGLKAPVRESGIEVILQSMEKHRTSERLMLKALQVLANVSCTMTAYSSWAIQQGFGDEDLERLMGSASDTLDYVKAEAVPFIQDVMDDFIKNEAVQDEGKKIMACFGYHFGKSDDGGPAKCSSLKPKKWSDRLEQEPMQQDPKRRVTFSNIFDILPVDKVEVDAGDSPKGGRRHTFCIGDIKQNQPLSEDIKMGKALSRSVDDSSIKSYQCPTESAPYDESDMESSHWKIPEILINDCRTVDEEKDEEEDDDDHGYEKVINLEVGDEGDSSPAKPQRGKMEDEEDEDVNAYEKVEVDERIGGKVDINENDYTELEALMAELKEIADEENGKDDTNEKDYDVVFDGINCMDKDGYEVPMTEEEVMKSRSGSMEHLVDSMEDDDFYFSFALLFDEFDDDDGYEKIEIGAQEPCLVSEVEVPDTIMEDQETTGILTPEETKDEESMEHDRSRYSEYSEIDIVEALVKSGLMNTHKNKDDPDTKSEHMESTCTIEGHIESCEEDACKSVSSTNVKIDAEQDSEENSHCAAVTSDSNSCRTEECKLENNRLERDASMKESEMETSESDMSNADENIIDNKAVDVQEKKDTVTATPQIQTRSFKKSINGNYQSVTSNVLRRKANREKRQGSVFGEEIRIENVNFRSDSLESDEGLGYQDSGDFKCSDVNNSFGFPAPAAEDGQSVDLEYASDSSTGQNGICDDPVYDHVCTDDENVNRNVFNSSPVSSISATFTEGSEDAVQDDKQETQSMGSLEDLCNVSEPRIRNVMSKSIHCLPSGDRQLMKERESGEGKPPKPRRTWYYRSSADVRKSIIRSFGLDADNIMRNPTYAQVTKPSSRVIHGSLPGRSNHGGGHRTMKRIPLTLSRHSKMIYKERFPSRTSKLGRNTSHDSGVLTGDEDSRSTIRDTEIYAQSHLYEEVATVTRDGERKPVRPEARKTLTMDEDTTETTYEVCTQWVNDETADAIAIFDRLTKKLVSPYSIIPIVREVEGNRRRSKGNVLEAEGEEEIDFPAWTSILNVLAADDDKWNLALAAQVLPVIDRLFYTKDEAIMDAAIELVHLLLRKFGRDIEKNHHGGLFRTKFRDDCRTCYHWMGKLHTRVSDLVRKETEAEEIDLDSMLHASLLCSLSEALKPFTGKSHSIKDHSK